MICKACGTENEKGFKFCVKCGSNLENPQEVNYEQVDMGGYHTEEEADGGFTFGSGTFTISDRAPAESSSDIYTADELNESEEEFDFSMYDEPFIPKLDTERVSLPQQPQEQQPFGQPPAGMPGMPAMAAAPPQGMPAMGGMPPVGGQMYGQPQMGGMPAPMGAAPMGMAQPQIVGYDPSGMPIYGQAPQPMMYAQPQIIGYDPSGMPIYGQAPQPMMYAQPQIIGYDPSGMPIYGQAPQPMMYAQPQIIGYDPSGMPIYSQPQPMMYGQPPVIDGNVAQPGGMPAIGYQQPGMAGAPQMGGMPGMPANPQPQPEPQKEERIDVPDDFWEFFDGGKATKHRETSDDFFGRSNHGDMGDISFGSRDMSNMGKQSGKKRSYMNDTPIVDAGDLRPNDSDKFSKMYMRKTDMVNADDLEANHHEKVHDSMGVTKEVDVDKLSSANDDRLRSRITMHTAGEADPDQLEAYVPEHKAAMMAQADHAVEALPKKKEKYVDELDLIELPEHMKAKKTIKSNDPTIPDLPDLDFTKSGT
ncbi:MAG TPA: hypothetical protein PLH83_16485 [Ruminococcus sp.]|nr:hypothetical protein [Ruminococcus sp.]